MTARIKHALLSAFGYDHAAQDQISQYTETAIATGEQAVVEQRTNLESQRSATEAIRDIGETGNWIADMARGNYRGSHPRPLPKRGRHGVG